MSQWMIDIFESEYFITSNMQHVHVKQHAGSRVYKLVNCYENRGDATVNLIEQSLARLPVKFDFEFTVCVGDLQPPGFDFYFSVKAHSLHLSFPQFIYDCWPCCGISDYEHIRQTFPSDTPASEKIGWIGNPITNQKRQRFIEMFRDTDFTEAITNEWNRSNPQALWKHTPTYLTIHQQVQRWKYLLDIEGVGWSARLPLLLSSPRIVFLVEREWVEWWHEHLVPWTHYIPIRSDFSNLRESYDRIEADSKLQNNILTNQRIFADKYLTRDAAIERIHNLLEFL